MIHHLLYPMDQCPKCQGCNLSKDGIVLGRQRYLCKGCRYHFTVEHYGKPAALKRQALQLYLEGLGFRAIGRLLQVSHVSAYKWIKAFGEGLEALRNDKEVEIVELDELHTYVGQKKIMPGSGWLLIEMGGDSSTAKWAPGAAKQEQSCGSASKRG